MALTMFNLAPVGMGRATFRLQVLFVFAPPGKRPHAPTAYISRTPNVAHRRSPIATRPLALAHRFGLQEILQIGRIPVYLYEDFPWLPYEGSGYSPADLGYIVSQVRTHGAQSQSDRQKRDLGHSTIPPHPTPPHPTPLHRTPMAPRASHIPHPASHITHHILHIAHRTSHIAHPASRIAHDSGETTSQTWWKRCNAPPTSVWRRGCARSR